MSNLRLKLTWQILLLYTWFVIIWGAFVRASGSGDGCGKNWPTCHGVLIPETSNLATWIEYIHRASSGLYGIYVLIAVIWAWIYFYKKPNFWRSGYFIFPFLVLFFTLAEALIGAKLVLSGLVGSNESWARAIIMVIHLVNTFLLVGSIMGTLHLITPTQLSEKIKNWPKWHFTLNALGLFLVASLGAITALGDTLYPSQSLAEGMAKDISSSAPILIQLRVFHPLLAVLVTLSVCRMTLAYWDKRYSKHLMFWMVSTLFIGVLNLLLLAPIAMQLIHLLWAQILWAKFCEFGFKNLNYNLT